MTYGLPQVCYLWLRISKGMLHVRHLAPKILMAVNYCGRQLAEGLGLAAPAYHRKGATMEGATPHPGSCKFSLQYDGRPDENFGVWVGMWKGGRSL